MLMGEVMISTCYTSPPHEESTLLDIPAQPIRCITVPEWVTSYILNIQIGTWAKAGH